MAVPVRLRSMPEHIRMPHLREVTEFQLNKQTEHSSDQQFLHFPATAYALWDSTSTGPPVFLHVVQNRHAKISLLEKVLWLLHKQCESEDVTNKVLVGSLTIDHDAEGVCFHIDGIDTQQGKAEAGMAFGDMMVPVQVSKSKHQERSGSVDDYMGAMKLLTGCCSSGDTLELSSFMLLKGWLSFYEGNTDKIVVHLQFDMVTMATVFKATPISGVPIVPTALAKNLSGPRSLSQVQGRPKSGYLTMDHTRKLLLVLESDPKVSSLPIVGIWVSGATLVHHPFVWAACIRYLHNTQVQDRVCTPPEAFLLVLYTPLHSKPEFYEVNTVSGRPELEFSLYNGYEITSFSKKSTRPDSTNIEWDVQEIRSGPKREVFDAAFQSFKSQGGSVESQNPVIASTSSAVDDIMPRSMPAPHTAKAMMVKPMVPEVSILWNDSGHPAYSSQNPSPYQPRSASSYTPSSFSGSTASTFSSTYSHAFQGAHTNPSLAPGPSQASGQMMLGDTSRQFPPPGHAVFPSKHSAINHPQPNTDSANPVLFKQSASPATLSPLPSSKPLHAGGDITPIDKGSGFAAHVRSTVTAQSDAPPVNVLIRETTQPPQLTPACINICRPKPSPQQPQVNATVSAAQLHPSVQEQIVTDHTHTTAFDLVGHQGTQHISNFKETLQPVTESPSLRTEVGTAYPHVVQAGLQSSLKGTQPHLWPQADRHSAPPTHSPVVAPSPESSEPYLCHHTSSAIPGKAEGQMYILASYQQSPQQGIQMHFPSCANPKVPVPHMLNVPNMSQGTVRHQSIPFSHIPQGTVRHQSVPVPHMMSVPSMSRGTVRHQSVPFSHMLNMPQGTVRHQSVPVPHMSVPNVSQGTARHQSVPVLNATNMSQETLRRQSDSTGLADPIPAGIWMHLPPATTQLPLSSECGLEAGVVQADSTASSGKSSDDSGLSVTPDNSNPSPKRPTSPDTKIDGLAGTGSRFSWDGVPPEVLQLLKQQDAQLKMLQAQIQALMAQQQQTSSQGSGSSESITPTPPPSSLPNLPKKPVVETQSVAVNTTMIAPDSLNKPGRCAFVQTSPIKTPSSLSRSVSQQELVGKCRGDLNETGVPFSNHTPRYLGMSEEEKESSGHTPVELLHQGATELTSTWIDNGSSVELPAAHLESTRSLSSAQQLPSISNSTPSPMSASMCVAAGNQEEEGSAEVSPDSKEYYDLLIDNIRLFLNSHNTEDLCKQTAEASGETENKLNMNFSVTNSPDAQANPSSHGGSTDTTLIPQINYLSMMLDSDSNTSIEINAMAMKYLRDEQLTRLVRLRQSPASYHNSAILRNVLAVVGGSSMADVSHMGTSGNNLSMATQQYMARHGLLGDGGESMLASNHTIQLQTNFSLTASSNSSGALGLNSSSKQPFLDVHSPCASPANRSPVKKELLRGQFQPSPFIPEEREVFAGTAVGVRDLGASPVLRPPQRHHFQEARPKSNHSTPAVEDLPLFPERYRHPCLQEIRTSECSSATDDDRILDIERLKQMPKLL